MTGTRNNKPLPLFDQLDGLAPREGPRIDESADEATGAPAELLQTIAKDSE